jgi:hypothetical protein
MIVKSLYHSKSTRDQLVYKILKYNPDGRTYTTPVTNTPLDERPYYGMHLVALGDVTPKRYVSEQEELFTIREGVIHTYTSLKGALEGSKFISNSEIYEAIVPGMTPYYLSYKGNSIGASYIIFTGICKKFYFQESYKLLHHESNW